MKRTFILGGVAALALTTAVGVAAAQQAPAHRGGDRTASVTRAEFVDARIARLTALDANRDGTVSGEEAQAGRQAAQAERQTAMFDRLDANHDGAISRAEFTAPRQRPDGAGAAGGPERAGHRFGGRHRGGHGPMMGGPGGQRGPVVIAEVRTKLTDQFAKLDADRDGVLTPAERQAGRAEMRERMQERRAARQQQASPSTAPSE